MRRGLIAWSKAEIPPVVFAQRVARAQAAMAAQGLDGLLLYTNHSTPGAASWFTGFVPYWGDGLVLIPRDAAPILVVSLSPRVRGWIERVSCLGRLVHAPRIGLEAASLLADRPDAVLGVDCLPLLPAGLRDDLCAGAAAPTLRDASALLAGLRERADPTEIALAGHAAAIAGAALDMVTREPRDIGAMLGAVEQQARRMGAEEIYLAAAPDLDHATRLRRVEGDLPLGRSWALRASVAYKGAWVRVTRSFSADPRHAADLARAGEIFAAAVARLPDAAGFAEAQSWLVEARRGGQPLAPLMGSMLADQAVPGPGALVCAQAVFHLGESRIVLGAPVLVGAAGEAAACLVPPLRGNAGADLAAA